MNATDPRRVNQYEWAKCASDMLAAAERYEKMDAAWSARTGQPRRPDPGARFVEIARAGARGEDVSEFMRVVLP